MDIAYYFKLEWSKYRKNGLAAVLLGAFVILFPFVILLGKRMFGDIPPPFPSMSTFYEFPSVWDYQGHVGNWLVCFCLGFLMIYMITSEVDYKTMRQGVINGMTRKEFFMSKIVSMVALAFFATIIFYISTIVIGLFHTEAPDISLIFDNNWIGFRFFLMSLGYMSLGFLIAIVIRRGFISLLFYFSYIMFVEVIIRAIVAYYTESRVVQFFPGNVIEDLVPNKLYEYADGMWFQEQFGSSFLLTHVESIVSGILYLGLFTYLSWLSFRKKDL